MAARAKAPRKRKAAAGDNAPPEAQVREYFDRIHSVTDDMEESNAATRGEIGRIYEAAAAKLDVTKSALALLFKKERRDRKDKAKAAKMDGRERDSLQKLSQSLGGALGDWAAEMAQMAPDEE